MMPDLVPEPGMLVHRITGTIGLVISIVPVPDAPARGDALSQIMIDDRGRVRHMRMSLQSWAEVSRAGTRREDTGEKRTRT